MAGRFREQDEQGAYASVIKEAAERADRAQAWSDRADDLVSFGFALARCGLPHAVRRLKRQIEAEGDREALLKLSIILAGSRVRPGSYNDVVEATNALLRANSQAILADTLLLPLLGTLGLYGQLSPWWEEIPDRLSSRVVGAFEETASTNPAVAIYDAYESVRSPLTLVTFSILLSDENDDRGALRVVDRALDLVPGHPDALATKLYVLDKLGRPQEGLTLDGLDARAAQHEYLWKVFSSIMRRFDKQRLRQVGLARRRFLRGADRDATRALQSVQQILSRAQA